MKFWRMVRRAFWRSGGGPFDPRPEGPRWAAIGAVVVLLAGGGAVTYAMAGPGPGPCAAGMSQDAGECIGVTDATSGPYLPGLASVERLIGAQNRYATQSPPDYVTLALMTPLSPGGDITPTRILAELEAAAASQYYYNNTMKYRPRIHLLLANEGSRQQGASAVAAQVLDQPAAENLVAVVGMGISTVPTIAAARQIARSPEPLAMIGTLTTADGLDFAGPPPALDSGALSGPVPGFFQLTPDTADEVDELFAHYFGQPGKPAPTASNSLLVEDSNPADLYPDSLANDFLGHLGDGLTTKYYGGDDLTDQFAAIASVICTPTTRTPPVVLYAGRGNLLPEFISQLRQQTTCPASATITVATGADADILPPATTAENTGGPQIKVVYADIADCAQLTATYRGAMDDPAVAGAFPAAPDLDDTWAIATYNGVWAVGKALLRYAAGSSVPDATAVVDRLRNFNSSASPINGATGPFWITSNGDEAGQALPVVVITGGRVLRAPGMRTASCMSGGA